MSEQKLSGEILRKMRHFKGIKQEDAAYRLAITQQAYSKMERAESVKVSTIQKVMNAFGCNKEDCEKIGGLLLPF